MLYFKERKAIRARIIKQYIIACGIAGCVCFSCGNASKALKDEGIYTVDISPTGDLKANRWWLPSEINKAFPTLFDATSGHLPVHLMLDIGKAFKEHLGELNGVVYLPTGSGETLVCLSMVYPNVRFIPVYDCNVGCDYESEAPLNPLVNRLTNRYI